MTKHEALRMVRQAKSSHIRWLAYTQAMAAGLAVEDKQAPVHHKECDFGHWFYQDGFKAFGHWQIFQDIEFAHELLHAVFSLLHQALIKHEPGRAAALLPRVESISHSLLRGLDLLQEEILASEQEVFGS
jgi:hypothetical protein